MKSYRIVSGNVRSEVCEFEAKQTVVAKKAMAFAVPEHILPVTISYLIMVFEIIMTLSSVKETYLKYLLFVYSTCTVYYCPQLKIFI